MFHYNCQVCGKVMREEEVVRYGQGFVCHPCLAKRHFAPRLPGLDRLKLGKKGMLHRPCPVADIQPGWLTHPEGKR